MKKNRNPSPLESYHNFSLVGTGFDSILKDGSLATKRCCKATYKRALRKFLRERSIYFLIIAKQPSSNQFLLGLHEGEIFFPLHPKAKPEGAEKNMDRVAGEKIKKIRNPEWRTCACYAFASLTGGLVD